jgi:hypothetical protein
LKLSATLQNTDLQATFLQKLEDIGNFQAKLPRAIRIILANFRAIGNLSANYSNKFGNLPTILPANYLRFWQNY